MYSFDSHGWLAPSAIQGRTTDVAPPTHSPKTVGQPYPNFTGVEWVMVSYVEPVIPAPYVVPTDWKITCLAFRNRFSQAEKIALYTVAKTNVEIQIYLDDVQAASYIDLTRADTIASVNGLEAATILAVGRAHMILSVPPTPEEQYKGILV